MSSVKAAAAGALLVISAMGEAKALAPAQAYEVGEIDEHVGVARLVVVPAQDLDELGSGLVSARQAARALDQKSPVQGHRSSSFAASIGAHEGSGDQAALKMPCAAALIKRAKFMAWPFQFVRYETHQLTRARSSPGTE